MNATPEITEIVYIVEDDEPVRESLEMLVDAEDYAYQSFASADAFLEAWHEQMAGCIILDIRMPGMDGMTLQKKLSERGSILPIIFVTGHGDVPMAVEAMQYGAVDFIQKPYREDQLLEKVAQAMQLNQEDRAVLTQRQKIQERLASLTPREREVMRMMVDGNANKVIAIDLEISQRTVEIHRSRVMQKMGTHSLAHLVKMVVLANGG